MKPLFNILRMDFVDKYSIVKIVYFTELIKDIGINIKI